MRLSAQLFTWNLQRRGPSTTQAQTLTSRISSYSPDIVCLTEAFEGSTAEWGGYEITARGVFWSQSRASERKVVLWSKKPWIDVDDGSGVDLGRDAIISATTETPIGNLSVAGVCIPYRSASPYGSDRRSKPWSEHLRFLSGLQRFVETRDRKRPLVVLGDFNQRIPRTRQPEDIAGALEAALSDLRISTAGILATVDQPTIDHIGISRELSAADVTGVDEHDENGRKLSDHFGVRARIFSA